MVIFCVRFTRSPATFDIACVAMTVSWKNKEKNIKIHMQKKDFEKFLYHLLNAFLRIKLKFHILQRSQSGSFTSAGCWACNCQVRAGQKLDCYCGQAQVCISE